MPSFRQRLLPPVLAQLKQGTAPEKLALAIAVGVSVGSIPLLGAATPLCLLLGVLLRLNHPVVQAANYAVYPLQVGLFLPLLYMGGRTLLAALAVWAVAAPLAGAGVYKAVLPALRRLTPREDPNTRSA